MMTTCVPVCVRRTSVAQSCVDRHPLRHTRTRDERREKSGGKEERGRRRRRKQERNQMDSKRLDKGRGCAASSDWMSGRRRKRFVRQIASPILSLSCDCTRSPHSVAQQQSVSQSVVSGEGDSSAAAHVCPRKGDLIANRESKILASPPTASTASLFMSLFL